MGTGQTRTDDTGEKRSSAARDAGNGARDEAADAAGETDSRATWKHEKKLKFTYKEQREYETIEDDIAVLEGRLTALDGEMAANATNSVKLGELMKEKEDVETQLEEKIERWEYLEGLAARIAGQE